MKVIGVIVEYNPLHNGHVHHIKTIKERSNPDIIVACMSSSVVNRGELSVFNKFDKTRLALNNNIDIIIEIPSIYTIQNADIYAKRATELLYLIGCSEIWIGSEKNDPNIFESYYELINKKEYNDSIKKYLNEGLSYKQSTIKALNDFKFEELLSNDILGLSYYKAIKDNNYNIKLNTIKRIDNNYNQEEITGIISSATSIRKNTKNIKKTVPSYTYRLYKEKKFIDTYKIFDFLKTSILSNNDLENIFLMEEGFHNSLNNIYKYSSYEDFLSSLNTKRYTNTRIKRIFLFILFNITKKEMEELNNINLDFIRILGYNDKGKKYINTIKKNVNIYTNIKNGISKILDIEIKISKILDTIYNLNLFELEQKGPIF